MINFFLVINSWTGKETEVSANLSATGKSPFLCFKNFDAF